MLGFLCAKCLKNLCIGFKTKYIKNNIHVSINLLVFILKLGDWGFSLVYRSRHSKRLSCVEDFEALRKKNRDASQTKSNRKECLKSTVSESSIQIDCLQAISFYKYDGLPISEYIYAIPNGGYRKKTEAVRLKKEGVMSGVPDLNLFISSGGYHSLYIEMKTPIGSLSEEQKVVIAKLRNAGHKVVVCRSISDFVFEVLKYLGVIK